MSVLGNMALDQLQALNALHMSTAMILFLFTNSFFFLPMDAWTAHTEQRLHDLDSMI